MPEKLLSDAEWNFNDVPDEQIVACCYWEYARESVSIRDAVKTAKVAICVAEQRISLPESEERKAFRATANQAYGLLVQTGFDISFWVGLPFPRPWRSVAKAKRAKWENAHSKIPMALRFPPFQITGDLCIAGALYAKAQKLHGERQAAWLRLSQIDSGVSNLEEATELRNKLSEQAQHPTPVVVRGMGGVDSFVAQVNWHEFTDKEVVASFRQWVEANRPTGPDTNRAVGRHSDRGHKLNQWRVRLDRLAMMRLLHHSTLRRMSRDAKEHYRSADWYRERKTAGEEFHQLFPFLRNDEHPLSWLSKGSRK